MIWDCGEAQAPTLEPLGLVLKYLSDVSLVVSSISPSTLTCLWIWGQKNVNEAYLLDSKSANFLDLSKLVYTTNPKLSSSLSKTILDDTLPEGNLAVENVVDSGMMSDSLDTSDCACLNHLWN